MLTDTSKLKLEIDNTFLLRWDIKYVLRRQNHNIEDVIKFFVETNNIENITKFF
jgi:hypothetical protein